MLSMSDTPINEFIPYFAETNTAVAFLVPTPTGYEKSIMDATKPLRELLKFANVHDYETQGQGQENKVIIESHFITRDDVINTSASLYRPNTKDGDPRIWFSDLKKYCKPCNLLAIFVYDKSLYVINLSNKEIQDSLKNRGHVFSFLQISLSEYVSVADELLEKLHELHKRGFIPSITKGDPGVGDTLENALGIQRNNKKTPDYKGIELKASRITKNGEKKTVTRSTLFTKVPDTGLTYSEILDKYGKVQIPRGKTEPRKQIYETLSTQKYNAYGLKLSVDYDNDKLNLIDDAEPEPNLVSSWNLDILRKTLLVKHHETFWVKAASEMRNDIEYFRYDKVIHTKNPNALLLAPLIENGEITADLAAHIKPDGTYRDHGLLFKIFPQNIHDLLGEEKKYDL
ncbi:MAG: MvaI/BcnI family restriction endonuclease [Treponema sp.]|nr:MvaI/BcnI family restriction endonuclease [Treponema sp.]MDY3759451.1 MvaI/BcnI family restriction endonuclease [Treponema sp.]MDY5838733.1 MvaI/BcnI family restriction endonuclease [Treponema sp.]